MHTSMKATILFARLMKAFYAVLFFFFSLFFSFSFRSLAASTLPLYYHTFMIYMV